MILPLLALAAPMLAPLAADAEAQRIRVPDLTLTDQHGAKARVAEMPEIVVLSFMFTTCETLCPVTNAILAELDNRLDDAGLDDVRLLSITLDPMTDRPEVLLATARALDASPRWRFLTGPAAPRLAQAFGISPYDIALHDPIIFIGRPDQGYFVARQGFPGPEKLIAAIRGVSQPR